MPNKPSLGIIGAGRLGTALTRQALAAGYTVRLANSRGPESMALTIAILLPGAIASTVEDAIRESDIVILATPLGRYRQLPRELLQGKIIIDAMNYWPPTEGHIPEFAGEGGSSEFIQQELIGATVVKSFNHVAYNELNDHAKPHGASDRRAIGLAGDDVAAKKMVEQLIDDFGFDSVDVGALREGRQLQPDTPLFNARLTAAQMRQKLTEK